MLEEHGAEWGDKVRIIGLSIDKDAKTVANHVKAKGWEKPEHYWRAKSDCSDVYQVKGVPHVMLIDKDGKIAFKGHPANRPDLAADLTNMLKGEKLTGEGCAPAEAPKAAEGGEAPAEKVPEGFKEVDGAAVNKEMDDFRGIAAEMQKELGDNAKGMMRDFCVLVLNQQFMPNSGKWYGKYDNYRVLVGSQAKIDACNNLIKEKVKGSFEVNEQLHPMG